MKHYRNKDALYFIFYNDFDYMKIQLIKEEIKHILNTHNVKTVYFDFKNVTFVDSTGIGFVLARYRDLSKKNITLIICNLSQENKVIFEMSGIFNIIRYQNKEVKL